MKKTDIERRSSFSFPGGGFRQHVLILGVDMGSSAHIDQDEFFCSYWSYWKGTTQGLEHTLTAEKMCSINFTVTKKKFCLSYITMEQIVIYLSMVQKFTNSKQKILKLHQVHYA